MERSEDEAPDERVFQCSVGCSFLPFEITWKGKRILMHITYSFGLLADALSTVTWSEFSPL